jgi:hypothetical protein
VLLATGSQVTAPVEEASSSRKAVTLDSMDGAVAFECARSGDLAGLERWLQAGGDVNVKDANEW